MNILITGSSGQLGSALVRILKAQGHQVSGLDLRPGPETTFLADLTTWDDIDGLVAGVDAVIHTASLHAPHVATHRRSRFVKVNIQGTLRLLEASARQGVEKFVYTSTTSVYGHAMEATERAIWVDETLVPQPRDIYDITKLAAEQMCRDVALETGMRCLSLRVGRFWDEPRADRAFYRLYRGLDETDVVQAHLKALADEALVYDVFNIAAQSPFSREDQEAIWRDARPLIEARVPEMVALFAQEGWELPRQIDRVYVIDKARELLGYAPTFNARELARAWLKAEVG